jgi:peptidoglycan/xylan/chitin deacetylase (PgdA/CDA1 family)
MKRLLYRIKDRLRPKALVLMYHRITELESDVWDIAVSPAHFEEQLQVLKKWGKVVPLQALAEGIRAGTLQKGSVAITFDDGYADNFLTAKPLLEKYALPATFFITSCNLGQAAEFWWDELEHLILYTPTLPGALVLEIAGTAHSFGLENEETLPDVLRQAHLSWKGTEQEPPSQRARVYLQVWALMRALPHTQQQAILHVLRTWAGLTKSPRPSYRSMTPDQVRELSRNPLFSIGIHTLTHPALALHSAEFQEHEIITNQQLLSQLTGNKTNLLAYPFGNYNHHTLAIAAKARLLAAVTTEEHVVKSNTDPYRLGRFQVKNWPGHQFEEQLQRWINSK